MEYLLQRWEQKVIALNVSLHCHSVFSVFQPEVMNFPTSQFASVDYSFSNLSVEKFALVKQTFYSFTCSQYQLELLFTKPSESAFSGFLSSTVLSSFPFVPQ